MNIVLFDPEELTTAPPAGARHDTASARVSAPAVRLPAADRRARHIVDVLGLGPGDSFRAGVVDGPVGTGRLVAVEADGCVTVGFEPGSETGESRPGAGPQGGAEDPGAAVSTGGPAVSGSLAAGPRPLHPVRLLLGHPRPIVLRRMLRDLSTLGIEQLVVVRTELGEKSYLESKLWQGDDVRQCLIEGAEQAGSTLLPRVRKAWRLPDALEQVVEGREGASRVVFDNEDAAPARGGAGAGDAAGGEGAAGSGAAAAGGTAGTPVSGDPGRIIAVGSERGWTDDERGILRDNGFESRRLGERILRTETAAIAAVTVTLRELGIV